MGKARFIIVFAWMIWLSSHSGTSNLYAQVASEPMDVIPGNSPQILTDAEQAWLKAHPDITFGYTESLEPDVIANPDGTYSGMMVDVLDLLNERLGTDFGLEVYSIPELLKNAQERKVDGILNIHPEYSGNLGLLSTQAFWPGYPAVFARKGSSFESPEDFVGKQLAIIDNVYFTEKLIEQYGKQATVLKVPDALEGLQSVERGEVDYFLATSYVSYFISKYQLFNVTTAYVFGDSPVWFGTGVRSDWPELVSILNKGIATISKEEIQTIVAKWSYLPATQETIELTSEERAWIAQRHTVRVRVRNFPPHVFLDGDEPSGIAIDYLKLIAERTGIRFVFVKEKRGLQEAAESMAQSQGTDLIFGMERDPEQQDKILFSQDYMSAPHVIYTRVEGGFIAGIDDLQGRTVAIAGSVHRFIDQLEGITVQEFPTTEEALKAVSQGQADACVCDLLVATYAIMERGFSNLKVAAPGPLIDRFLCFGNRPDWPQLTSVINKGLATLTQAERSAIQGKYLSMKYEYHLDYSLLWKVGIVAALVMGLTIYWNRRLTREVSYRKQAEQSAEDARNVAQTANRAKSAFLANMSHELRTPLNAILGFSQLLGQDPDVSAAQNEKISIINRSGEHLLSMVDEIMSLSRIEAGRLDLKQTTFDLKQMLRDVGQMMQSRAQGKGLRFTLELDAQLVPYVLGDAGKIRQVLINLLGNAVKFTAAGDVWLRASSQSLPDDPDRVTLQFEVQDTGPGIPQNQLGRIFDSFVQVEQSGQSDKGAGLGLAISNSLVNMMGGSLDVESGLGQGTLFKVSLPLPLADRKTVMPDAVPTAKVIGLQPGQPTWRILVVDDNPENRLLLKQMLTQVGFTVQEAANGQEAVAQFQQWHPHFIWMDMRMPVMDGYEATKTIRTLDQGRAVKIVSVTASVLEEQREQIMACGCDDLVRKPFRDYEIFDAMARHLDIHYLYQEAKRELPKVQNKNLTAEMLKGLPVDLLTSLRVTTLSLNREAALEVIDRIASQAPGTAHELRVLVENFQMGRIKELLGDGDEH